MLGLNAVSDGRHVVLAAGRPPAWRPSCAERGYEPIGVDLSELLKAGGGAKCCTLELRADELLADASSTDGVGRRTLRTSWP